MTIEILVAGIAGGLIGAIIANAAIVLIRRMHQ